MSDETDVVHLPKAVVAGHGDFASGIVSAVDQITGRGAVLHPLTNKGMSGDEILNALRDTVASIGAHVVFTDLPAGSWTIAARRLQRDRPDLVVVTGANLPALLDFVFQTEGPPGLAARHSAEKGRGAILVFGTALGTSPDGAAGAD